MKRFDAAKAAGFSVINLAAASTLALILGGMVNAVGVEAQDKQAQGVKADLVRSFPAAIAKRRMQQPDSTGLAEQAKVTGGRDAIRGQFKWQVGLIQSHASIEDPFRGFFCGASLIGWRWVLTAAHCTYENDIQGLPVALAAERVHVYLGSHDFTAGQRLHVKRIVRHEHYDPRGDDNDLALMELDAEPQIKSGLELLRLVKAVDVSTMEPGYRATVLGWGSTGRGVIPQHLRQPVQILQYVDIQVKPSDECNQRHLNDRRAYHGRILKEQGKSDAEIRATLNAMYHANAKLITDNMICAGTNEESKDACFGDSGGPLVVYRADGPAQAGIVSWGPTNGCGLTDVYGVYVRVSRYLNWIAGKTN